MWNVKWLSAFLSIVNIKCSMIVGNYLQCSSSHKCAVGLQNKDYCANCINLFSGISLFNLTVPETKSPHDLSNNFWHELSSPYTESSDESYGETTTQAHEPFFEENSSLINSTTQLGSDVYLHCRVNDLREKMVRKVLLQTSMKVI